MPFPCVSSGPIAAADVALSCYKQTDVGLAAATNNQATITPCRVWDRVDRDAKPPQPPNIADVLWLDGNERRTTPQACLLGREKFLVVRFFFYDYRWPLPKLCQPTERGRRVNPGHETGPSCRKHSAVFAINITVIRWFLLAYQYYPGGVSPTSDRFK